jgi:hypothetical protein
MLPTRSTYEDLCVATDALYEEHLNVMSELNGRRKVVDDAHARPALKDIAADKTKTLFRAWTDGGEAITARCDALAPFDAEFDAHVKVFNIAFATCCARHGWTVAEYDAEVDRRCTTSLDMSR